jgi:hypothetical protein
MGGDRTITGARVEFIAMLEKNGDPKRRKH